jgi:hypothetical protein
MMAGKDETEVDTLLMDLLGRISTAAHPDSPCVANDREDDAEIKCADVTGFAQYLVEHVGRLPSLATEDDWLTFVAEGANSVKPDIADSAKTLHGALRGHDDGRLIRMACHHGKTLWPSQGAATVARVYCSHYGSLGAAIDTWAQSEALFRDEEAPAHRRLFYLDIQRGGEASAMLVWLTHFDEDHLPARRMADVWRTWNAHGSPASTMVLISGDDEDSCYSFSGDGVLPMISPRALVSLFLIGAPRRYLCGMLLLDRTRPVGALTHGVHPAVQPRKIYSECTEAFLDSWLAEPLGLADRAETPMPLFSTLDLFFGRRRKPRPANEE